ncbi:4-coumarate--CoA ligase 1-like [Gigantopelta aegis]|uniref:4-coumarate--CoA ligase 1-like n=1 Tax=Gigantopelta aegis TaxID=1735272 RepID=UPI001B8892A0|nr:4-coumarate--CoA ligase 1-like [Gigantopelta aegis]
MESTLHIPNVSVSTFILEKCKTFGNKTALVDSETDRKLSFNECISLVRRIANGLLKEGFQKGDTLFMFTKTCLEYPCCILATAAIGGTLQAASPNYTSYEMKHAFATCRPSYVMTSPDLVEMVREVNSEDVKKIITFGEVEGCLSFDDLILSCPDNQPIPDCDLDPARATAAQLFSSGTTGLPKSVQISHRNIVANIVQSLPLLTIKEGDIFLCFLPFFHIYAIVVLLSSLFAGSTVVVMKRFHPTEFLENIPKYQVTHLSLVPPVMLWLTKHPSLSYDKLKSVKGITCGAAPLSKEVEDQVREIFHLDYICQGYGMTECLITHIASAEYHKYGSVGKTVPMTECKIIKPESDEILKNNDKGEVCVRGPQVMLGYLSNPVATSSTIDADGWLHTGDIGYIDDEGFLFIVDRIKELIKYKAFQVAPAELEEVLLQHPGVADVGVIGIYNNEAGELPKAFVVKVRDAEVTENELKSFVIDRLSNYKQLRGGVEFVTEIPKSPSGKILRRLLREREK